MQGLARGTHKKPPTWRCTPVEIAPLAAAIRAACIITRPRSWDRVGQRMHKNAALVGWPRGPACLPKDGGQALVSSGGEPVHAQTADALCPRPLPAAHSVMHLRHFRAGKGSCSGAEGAQAGCRASCPAGLWHASCRRNPAPNHGPSASSSIPLLTVQCPAILDEEAHGNSFQALIEGHYCDSMTCRACPRLPKSTPEQGARRHSLGMSRRRPGWKPRAIDRDRTMTLMPNRQRHITCSILCICAKLEDLQAWLRALDRCICDSDCLPKGMRPRTSADPATLGLRSTLTARDTRRIVPGDKGLRGVGAGRGKWSGSGALPPRLGRPLRGGCAQTAGRKAGKQPRRASRLARTITEWVEAQHPPCSTRFTLH